MKKIICYLFGHKYSFIRRINYDICEVFCERCYKEFGIHQGYGTILPLDDDLKFVHKILLGR